MEKHTTLLFLGFISYIAGLSYINWMLGNAKLTHLFIWKVIQHISVYLWHFRIVLDLYTNYVVVKNWNYIWNEMPPPFLVTSYCGILFVTFILTPYWTNLEAKRLYRQHSHRTLFSNPIMNDKKEKTTYTVILAPFNSEPQHHCTSVASYVSFIHIS